MQPFEYRTPKSLKEVQQDLKQFGSDAKLIAGGFATTDLAAPAHAGRLYHLQYKPWYRLLGGRKSAITCQVLPRSWLAKSCPVLVPT